MFAYYCLLRSSRLEVFWKKGVLRNFAKFTGKHLCQSLFFNNVAGLKACNFIEKDNLAQVFSMNFAKFLNTFFYRTPPMAASVYYHEWIINQILNRIITMKPHWRYLKKLFRNFLLPTMENFQPHKVYSHVHCCTNENTTNLLKYINKKNSIKRQYRNLKPRKQHEKFCGNNDQK